MERLLFSIIIPAYNVEFYLNQCLDSIIKQSYSIWEAIVIDDGSTDKTGIIADKYSCSDNRIHVIHQKNKGVSFARNKGLEESNGEWICFVDADDFIHPQYLQRCYQIIMNYSLVDLILFNHIFSKQPNFKPLNQQKENKKDIRVSIPIDIWNNGLWGAIYRKNFISNRCFLPYSFAEDTLFFRQCLLRTSFVITLPETLYAYRQREGSAMTSSMTLQKLADGFDSYSELYRTVLSSNKILSRKAYQDIWRNLFEWPILRINALPKSARTKAFLLHWFQKNQENCIIGKIPYWYISRFYLASKIRFLWLVYLLMALPLQIIIKMVKIRTYIKKIK